MCADEVMDHSCIIPDLYPCKPDIFEETYEEVSDRVSLTSETVLTENKAKEILGLND
jgi:hypothetical protein